MVGDERLRLFVALPLPDDVVDRLTAWQLRELGAPRGARLVPPENLHVTVAFLGSRPASDVPGIVDVLRGAAAGARAPLLRSRSYRETRSVGMVVLEDEDERATRLAVGVASGLERLGVYTPERRPWLPHVTVLRFRERPRLAPPVPGLGAFSPSEVALYHSVLRPGGAQYAKRESVALGGLTT